MRPDAKKDLYLMLLEKIALAGVAFMIAVVVQHYQELDKIRELNLEQLRKSTTVDILVADAKTSSDAVTTFARILRLHHGKGFGKPEDDADKNAIRDANQQIHDACDDIIPRSKGDVIAKAAQLEKEAGNMKLLIFGRGADADTYKNTASKLQTDQRDMNDALYKQLMDEAPKTINDTMLNVIIGVGIALLVVFVVLIALLNQITA